MKTIDAIKEYKKTLGWRKRIFWFFKTKYLGVKYKFQDYINKR